MWTNFSWSKEGATLPTESESKWILDNVVCYSEKGGGAGALKKGQCVESKDVAENRFRDSGVNNP